MSESTSNIQVQENPLPTKLTLFFQSSDNQLQFVREHLSMLPDLVQNLKYKFTFEMPTVHAIHETKEDSFVIEKYINWRGKERERKVWRTPDVYGYQYYLQFSKQLSPEELDFWRAIKLGFICHQFDPNGEWRKH